MKVFEMSKTSTLTIRLEPEIKEQARLAFSELGLTLAEATRQYIQKIANENANQVENRIPNAETRLAMDNILTKKGEFYTARNVNDILKHLEELKD